MIDAYNETLPYRIAFAVVFFFALGIRDWVKHPENPTRVKEYGFLVVSMLVSIVYGVFHDHITATISPEYFLKAKGLANDPQPFRIAVTWLAIKATYGPGLLAGAFLLIANNPSPKKPQLPYSHLLRICVYPVFGAASCAIVGGLACNIIGSRTWLANAALAYATADRVPWFLTVWGIHAGSYIGAALGTVLAVVRVVRTRKSTAKTTS